MVEMARSLMDYAAPPVARANATASPARPMSIMDYISELDLLRMLEGTGIPERAAAANDMLNPLAAIPRAQAASGELFAPDRTPMERVNSGAEYLAELGSIFIPMAGAVKAGRPAINALAEGMTGMQAQAGNALADMGQVGQRFAMDEAGNMPLPFARDATPEGKAQTILDMLQSGRAGEVTDDMLDLGDATQNARLNQYLFRNYDLPMDEASRMQRAGGMGFDTGAYHGTHKDYAAVKDGTTLYTTPDPSYASIYGNPSASSMGGKSAEDFSSPAPNVMSLITNNSKALDTRTAQGNKVFRNSFLMKYGNGTPLTDRGVPDWVEAEDFREMFDDQGLPFNAVYADEGKVPMDIQAGKFLDRGISTAHFDPRNIRSRFARFDPRLAHLRNLSAGVAPFGLLTMPPNEEQ